MNKKNKLIGTTKQIKLLTEVIFQIENTKLKNTRITEIFLLQETIEIILKEDIHIIEVINFKKLYLIIEILFLNNSKKFLLPESLTLVVALLKMSGILNEKELKEIAISLANKISVMRRGERIREGILDIKEIKKGDNKDIFLMHL